MDNPEYELLKELRGRYRSKYQYLTISLGRNGSRGHSGAYSLHMTYEKQPPQIEVILVENGNKVKVKLAKRLPSCLGGDEVTLASPHMLTRLDKIVHHSVLEYIKNERENRITTSASRVKQREDLKHQIERLNSDVKMLAGVIAAMRKNL